MRTVFVHVPRTGGTSFNQLLRAGYGRAFFRIPPGGGWRTINKWPRQAKCVSGHHPWGMWGDNVRYVTILRDPVERLISLWWFSRKRPNHKCHRLAQRSNVAQFVISSAFADLENGMTRWISGRQDVGRFPPKGKVDFEDLERAEDRLTRTRMMFTETLDADMLMFAQEMGWDIPPLERKQVVKKRPPRWSIKKEFIRAIQAHNEHDMELYRWALEQRGKCLGL